MSLLPRAFRIAIMGGGGITGYAVVSSMLEQGHKVSVSVLESSAFTGGKTEDEHIRHLQGIGADVTVLPSIANSDSKRFLKGVFPSFVDLFPGFKKQEAVREYLEHKCPDAVFMYNWNAIASTYGIRDFPKIGIVGDPIHLPFLFRKEFHRRFNKNRSFRQFAEDILDYWRTGYLVEGMKRLLLDCDARGAFAAHHAKMLEEMGIKNCQYFRTPVLEPLPPKKYASESDKFKIIHIGHLQGIATLSGIELLAREILPNLLMLLSSDSFEIHIVGGFFDTIPEELKRMLIQPNVKIRGPIYPPDEEFLSSHITLVPTPIELGIRVRIINAFSFGSCVIAHESNKSGIPELEHGVNCLLGNDGKSIADLCSSIYRNPELRERLEKNARHTYERYFSLETAGSAICQTLAHISL